MSKPVYSWDFKKPSITEVARRAMITHLVCEEFGCTIEELGARDRKRMFNDARGVYCYLRRKYLPDTLEHIAEILHRDHSSVIHQLNRIGDLIKVNDPLVKNIERIENKLLSI
jgi:chromosomal replication initiation ATPase DnaA